MGRLIRKFILAAGACMLLPAMAGAQALQNSASGELNNISLDLSQATVTLNRANLVDPALSSVTVDPPVVTADGIEFSTITVTLRDANNQPLPGRTVSLASSRGALDVVTQPLNPTDVNGVTTGEIRSTSTGVAQAQATDIVENTLLNDQPDVLFTQGEVLQLTKTVRPDRAMVGDVVTYSIEIQNTTTTLVSGVRIADAAAPVLNYIPGTAQLDGVAIADPLPGTPMMFDIGDVQPSADRLLTYSMVVGAGARVGNYENIAIAVDLCDACAISAPASASLEIGSDPIFDLGTIIGKVFHDRDGDGWQDSGESGVSGAMVALDNGVYALTDTHGRFHFPAIEPGQRMVKLNLAALSGNARATDGDKQVLTVTPGLLAKANFGITFEREQASIGRNGEYGLSVDASAELLPDRLTGSAGDLSLVINGVRVQFADGDVSLTNTDANSIIHMGENGQIEPLQFAIRGQLVGQPIDDWTLRIWRDDDDNVKTLRGSGEMPDEVPWENTDEIRELLLPGRVYFYQLEAFTGDARITSRRGMFGVNRETSIALELRGGAFEVGSHELTEQAERLLTDAAKIMREHPDETIRIYGHTDSTGARADNQVLSESRANVAYDYLVGELGIPAERFIVRGFGEDRPVASNETETGRELNRRVEIIGELTAVERARLYETRTNDMLAAMDGLALELDEAGQFSQTLTDSGRGSIDLQMVDRVGQSIRTTLDLPGLQIDTAGEPELRRFADDDPRRQSPGPEPDGASYTYELAGRTEPGNVITIDNVAVPISADGSFQTALDLKSGTNRQVLSVKNAKGLVRYANLELTVATDVDGEPVIAVAPVPELVLQLPPEGIPLRHAQLIVPGFTSPGNRVAINGQEATVDHRGQFIASVPLRPGSNRIVARVTDPRGYTGEISRDIEYEASSLFIMALADGKISQIRRDGNLAAAGADSDSETVTEGRVALYLKGTVLGKYLVTAAFDTGQSEIGELFSDLDAIENERLITNIDPDTVYPVYGDDSTLVYDADSQGKLYLALDGEQFDAVVGNYALSFTDTELTTYQRTLFGAHASYESARKTGDGRAATKAEAFVAQIDQAPVRDQIAATGGSLYFLSHTDVIEGSEQVSLLVHDQHTGLLLQRINQQRNVDYDIKYREGRIWFRRPVSSVIDDGALIGANLLAGNPITVQVDYETPVDGLEASVSGGRLKQFFAEGKFGIGGTFIEDDRVSSEYSLHGIDAELRLRGTRIVAEYAESTGSDSLVFRSSDGGLQFAPVATAGMQTGNAYKLAAEFDAGEWFGRPDTFTGSAYYRRLTAGFASNGNFSQAGERQVGAAMTYKFDDRNTFLLRVDDLQAGQNISSTLTSLQWRHQRENLSIEGEFQDRRISDASLDGSVAALRATYQWTDQINTTLQHQEAVSGDIDSQSAAEVEYALNEDLRISGRFVTGPNGEAFQAGASWDTPAGRLYAEQRVPGGSGETGHDTAERTLIGAEAPFGAGGTVYTEYQWDHSGEQRGLRSISGLRRDWRITDGLSLLVSGEQTTMQSGSGGANEQNAVVGGLSYDLHGLRFSTRNEWRRQQGTTELSQFASFNHGEIRLPSGFTMLGEYRLSSTDDRLQPDQSTELEEASLGLAIRPIEHDRWNLLFKLTRLDSEATPAQVDSRYDNSTSDLLSADWSLQINRYVEWVGKQAFKKKLTDLESGINFETNTSLSIQRLNFRAPLDLSFGVEYRMLRQKEADDERTGFLGELMWNGFENIGIGVGYNFTEFSSDLRFDSNYSEYGWFLRLQGLY